MTGLRQRCAVFVDWTMGIKVEEIIQADVGHVTQKLFDAIMDRYQRHQAS
jgi:hypothetical protein